jgi:hypothetical protein
VALGVRARTSAAALSGICAAAAAAVAFYEPAEVSGDLDGDPGAETARTVRYEDPDEPAFERTTVNVSDTCASGPVDRRVAGPQDSLARLKLVRADTRPGKDVYVELRSGVTGRSGEARLVAWRPTGAEPCVEPRHLFRYDAERPTRRPQGASYLANFAVVLRDLRRSFEGREVRLHESFARRGEGACCPSIEKRSYYRYSRTDDRYRRYATKVIRRRPNR